MLLITFFSPLQFTLFIATSLVVVRCYLFLIIMRFFLVFVARESNNNNNNNNNKLLLNRLSRSRRWWLVSDRTATYGHVD
jgi:hypothetical protein